MASKSLKKITKKTKANYISKLVLRSFMIAAVVFFAIILIFTFTISRNDLSKVPRNNKSLFGAYVIVSESMIPTIDVNDAIVVKKIENNNLEIGDIITFSSKDYAYNGLTITHRIVGIQESMTGEKIYRTKGDNNLFIDTAVVDLNSIYGKVVLVIPKVGYIKSYLSSACGFITLIVLPIFIVIVYEVFRIRKLLNKQEKEIRSI